MQGEGGRVEKSARLGASTPTPNPSPPPTGGEPIGLSLWVVTDGRAGIENQALGLAEAVARLTLAEITIKRIRWRPAIRRLPTRLNPFPRLSLQPGSDRIAPPWPDLWIANGRASIPLSIAVRRWSRGHTFVVQLQDPLRAPRLFDLVIPPRHDKLEGENVFPITGTPHRVTPERLAAELDRFRPQLDALPHPRVAILIGGRSKAFDISEATATRLGGEIGAAVEQAGGSVMVTFSRRTPPAAERLMRAALEHLPGVIWSGEGDNPYFAFLAAADHILVTEDSANMPAEAAATGAPVHLLKVDGAQARKRRFHAELNERGIARRFSGALEDWYYPPVRETERAAAEVLRRLNLVEENEAD